MSWSVEIAGRSGEKLKEQADERFSAAAKACAWSPAEQQTVEMAHGIVTHVLNNCGNLPLKISGHGSVFEYQGNSTHSFSLKIEPFAYEFFED